jgi:hypothetical protein
MNLAPAMAAALDGYAMPMDFLALALLTAAGLLISLAADWFRGN